MLPSRRASITLEKSQHYAIKWTQTIGNMFKQKNKSPRLLNPFTSAYKNQNQKGTLGPVGLLVEELKHIDATIDQDFNIKQDKEIEFSLIHTPWQSLKNLVEQAAKRSRLQKISADREFLGGLQEFDNVAFQDAIKRRSEEELSILKYISTGAAWAQSTLCEIGRTEDDKCQMCGEKEWDIRHTLWECKEVHGENTERMRALRPLLPTNLQFGIPGPITKDLDRTYWGFTYFEIHNEKYDFTELMGIAKDDRTRRRMGNMNATAELSYKDNNIITDGRNPRQIFQQLKGNNMKSEDFTQVAWCEDTAPPDINVYADGSFKNPRRPAYSLAGAGVWWPGRNLKDNPCSESEEEMGFAKQENGGVSLRVWLAGFGGSSTRAELAAGLIALQYPGAVHIGTDSQAFLTKAMMLRDMAKKSKKPRRPWSTQPDGDLWEVFYNTLRAKNPLAFRATKVKGHAMDDMITENKVRKVDKDGNDKADRVADGVQCYSKDIVQTSGSLTKRHIGHTKFINKIHENFIEAVIKKNEKINDIEKNKFLVDASTEKRQKILHFITLPFYGSIAQTWNNNMIDIKNFKAINDKYDAAPDVQDFMQHIKFQKCVGEEQGTSWLELYILYKLSGGRCPVKDPSSKAMARPSMRAQTKSFKEICRYIASRL